MRSGRPVCSCHSRVCREAVSRIHRPRSRMSRVLLRERDELSRRDGTALRMIPAHERLGSGDGARVDVDDGLVGDVELAAFERALEVGLQLHPGDRGVVQLGLVRDVALPAARLGRVHRDVGTAEQLVGIAAVGRAGSRSRCSRATTISRPPTSNGGASAWRIRVAACPASVGSVSSTMTANSSPPRRATVSPARVAACRRSPDGDQQAVALRMAEAIVDRLEVIEVEVQDGRRERAAGGARQRVPESVTEEGAIREPGQRRRGTPGGEAALRAPCAR